MSRYLRDASPEEEQHASYLELFFDLVFVFAVTQVSHLLLGDLTWRGWARSGLVLLVVWWAWNYTTWVTNMLDPDAIAVRLLVLAIMFASLVMAVAIPDAFGSRALLFAGAYVAIQVGRHAFLTFVVATPGSPAREPALHILIWFVVSGAFWLGGGLASGQARIALWLVALAIDYAAPFVLYRVPGRPRLAPSAWDVETSHFAERFQLFVIIALGESIVAHRRDDVGALAGRRADGGVRPRLPLHRRALVAVLQLRRLDRPAAPRACLGLDDARARRIHVPPRRDRRRRDRLGRG